MNDRDQVCPICRASAGPAHTKRNGFPIAQCKQCGSQFAVLTEADLPKYDSHYQDGGIYEGYRNQIKAEAPESQLYWYQPKILDMVGPGRGRKHLDLGSGFGVFGAVAKARGWSSYGVDVSEYAADVARKQYGVETFIGDLSAVDWGPGSVSWVSAFEVLEHVLDPRAEVARVHALLEEDGYFSISVPNGCSRNERTTKDALSLPPHHVNYFSLSALCAMMEGAGFETVFRYEKPFAWGELGLPKALRVALLPLLLVDGYVLGNKGNRIVWVGRKR